MNVQRKKIKLSEIVALPPGPMFFAGKRRLYNRSQLEDANNGLFVVVAVTCYNSLCVPPILVRQEEEEEVDTRTLINRTLIE